MSLTATDMFCGAGGSSIGAEGTGLVTLGLGLNHLSYPLARVEECVSEKRCRLCGQSKSIEEFYRRPGSKDGYRSECKGCIVARAAKSTARRRDAVREYQSAYRLANKERLTEQARERARDPNYREARRSYHRQYRSKTLTRRQECEAAYRRRNPERYQAIRRDIAHRFSEAHPGLINAYAAKRRARVGIADAETSDYYTIVAADPCTYCGELGGTADHIEALYTGGAHNWTNLTGACGRCNSSKGIRPVMKMILERCVESLS